MSRYILISVKKKLPLFIISIIMFAHMAFVMSVNANFLEEANEFGYVYNKATTNLIIYIILFMIFMFILPLFSMNYRYSLAKSDLFRQAPYKKNRIRYIEHLTTLGIVVGAFTLGFFFSMFMVMIMNHFATIPEEALATTNLIKFHYGYYLLAYIAVLAMGVMQYFISYLFVSRSNNLLNSVIMLLLGQLILLIVFYQPIRFFFSFGRVYNSTFVLPILLYNEVFEGLIVYGTPTQTLSWGHSVEDTFASILYILQYVVYAAIAILGIVAFIIEKDPSSEYAGKAKTNKPYQDIIFHLGAFLVGSFMCALTQTLLYFLISYVFFLAGYYTFFGMLNRNFVPKVKDIIILVSVALGVMLFCGALFIQDWINSANGGEPLSIINIIFG